MRGRLVLLVPILMWAAAGSVSAAQISSSVTINGMLDTRLAWTDGARGWEDRGLGKLRFSGDGGGQVIGHAEASASVIVRLGWNVDVIANVSLDPRRSRTPVDLMEAFVRYKSSPASRTRFEARAGAFFPPVSLENTGLAWTSPYTLTSSAINTWVGEELRTIGAEAGVSHYFDDGEIGLRVAVFGANDPAGVLLAWRGWALSDREAGVFDRLPLAPLRIITPGGQTPQQAPWFEPLHEIDDRPGVYAVLDGELEDLGRAQLTLYDNRARDTAFDGFQYAWHTRFAALGVQTSPFEGVDVVFQAMRGDTTMGTAVPGIPLVAADFTSAFILVSRAWDRHRITARAEYFETRDKDTTVGDDNNEHGTAVTMAYVFRPLERHRLTIELTQGVSFRPERAFIGESIKARETQLQASYRIFF